jgi:hypothetical protein
MIEPEIANDSVKEPPQTSKALNVLLICCIAPILPGMVLGWLDNATQLAPDTDDSIMYSLIISGACGVVAAICAFVFSRGMTIFTRLRWIFPLLVIGSVGPFLFIMHASSIVSGWINFPPSKTHSRIVLMQISRAYQMHGKGAGAHIQTQPFWTDLNIEKSDYEFMQNHRIPEDAKRDPDEIKSEGYFCVSVTIEEAGKAVRIMHAGNNQLPAGSILICPYRRVP